MWFQMLLCYDSHYTPILNHWFSNLHPNIPSFTYKNYKPSQPCIEEANLSNKLRKTTSILLYSHKQKKTS
jgi:hypothetical protein